MYKTSTDSSIPSFVNLATNEIVTTINFDKQLISKLIVTSNPHKAHWHNGLHICISKLLSIKFRNCLKDGYFLAAWKKINVGPIHKKGKKNKFWIIIDLFPCYVFVANILQNSFLIKFFNTSSKTNCLIQINQASCLAISVYISLFKLPMKYMPLLVTIPH